MIPIIYEASETAFTSNGLGRLRDAISVTATEEKNGVYEIDFEYPVDGANFDLIQPGRIIYATHDDSGIPQPFDIKSYSKPISGVVSFHATHVSYRQSALTVSGAGVNSLADAFTLLATAEPSNPFTYTADFTSTAYLAAADGVPRSVRQMLGGIEGSILDAYGGEYEFDKFDVILHKARGIHRDFTIRYGLNMLDYNDDTDYSGSYSACIPYWTGIGDDGNDTVVIGDRVDSGLPMYNGRNDCIPLDLTEKFEDKPTKAALESMAAAYMSSQQVNLPAQTISVDFVRLQDMGEFSAFQDLLQCNLCDTINVVFPRYGMQGTFKIVKTVYNVLSDRYESMELGALSTSLADALGISDSAETRARINDLSVGGDLAVGGDANIVGDLSAGGTVNGVDISKVLTRGNLTTTSHSTSSVTVTATTDSGDQTATFTKAGYYPYAIAGFNVTGTNRMFQNLYELAMTSRGSGTCTITYRFRNNASVSVTIGLTVYILWIEIL